MLPPLEKCRARIKAFKSKYPRSTFNVFWDYKTAAEKSESSSILDDDHLEETAKRLADLLSGPFGMGRTGVAGDSEMVRILQQIAPYYGKVRHIVLGEGNMAGIREYVGAIYDGLNGITNRITLDKPSSITGRSKALMFIWGQTPGFDRYVRWNVCKWIHSPERFPLPHVKESRVRYTSKQFCDIIEELDGWVSEWPTRNNDEAFWGLDRGLPIGRIIDMIYTYSKA